MKPLPQRWFAIPLRDDGTERPGTIGVLVGEYRSKETFLRYRVNKYGVPGEGYQLYIKGEVWRPQGTHTVPPEA